MNEFLPELNYKFKRILYLNNLGSIDVINSAIRIKVNKSFFKNSSDPYFMDVVFTDDLGNIIPHKILNIDSDNILILLKTSIKSGESLIFYVYYGGEKYENDEWGIFFDVNQNLEYYNFYGHVKLENDSLYSYGISAVRYNKQISILDGLSILSKFEVINPQLDYFIRIGLSIDKDIYIQDNKLQGIGYYKSGSNYYIANHIDTTTYTTTINAPIKQSNILFCNLYFYEDSIYIARSVIDSYDNISIMDSLNYMTYINKYTRLYPIIYTSNIRIFNLYMFNEMMGYNIKYSLSDEQKITNKNIYNLYINSTDDVTNMPFEINTIKSRNINVYNGNNIVDNIYNNDKLFFVTNASRGENILTIYADNTDNIKQLYNNRILLFYNRNNDIKDYIKDVFNNEIIINDYYILYEKYKQITLKLKYDVNAIFILFDSSSNLFFEGLYCNDIYYDNTIEITHNTNSIFIYNYDSTIKMFLNYDLFSEFNIENIDSIVKILDKINILYIIGFNITFENDNIVEFINNYIKIKNIEWR